MHLSEERLVDVAPGVRLWAERIPSAAPADHAPVLLVMGANASGVAWPEPLVDLIAEQHPVIRYDHRDTGRSTHSADDPEYGFGELAADAVAVLDAFDVPRAHVVGMSMGGLLVQLMLLDHPERLATATLLCTGPLPDPDAEPLPGPSVALTRLWAELDDLRDDAAEMAFRLDHWRLLNGSGTPFDATWFRALEERVIEHSGSSAGPTAHARLDPTDLVRGAELAAVEVPTLVIEAPEDPAYPPPNAGHLARAIGSARLVRIPGMGHALNRTVLAPLAAAVLGQTTTTRVAA